MNFNVQITFKINAINNRKTESLLGTSVHAGSHIPNVQN